MIPLYFAYGANMNIESMSRRCPGARPCGTWYLRDWRLRFYSHATIEPAPGHGVAGVLWQLTPECLDFLDCFEGYPDYYTRRTWQQDGVTVFFYEIQQRQGHSHASYIQDIARSYGVWKLDTDLLHEALEIRHETDVSVADHSGCTSLVC